MAALGVVSVQPRSALAQSPPSFALAWDYPSAPVAVGESFEIEARIYSVSGTGARGGISFSFPQLAGGSAYSDSYTSSVADVREVRSNGMDVFTYAEGDTINHADGREIRASHLLIESDGIRWSSSTDRTLRLRVTPKRAGGFEFRVRGWICADGYQNCARQPSPGSPRDEGRDQQGYSAVVRSVSVESAPTPMPPTITPTPTNTPITPTPTPGRHTHTFGWDCPSEVTHSHPGGITHTPPPTCTPTPAPPAPTDTPLPPPTWTPSPTPSPPPTWTPSPTPAPPTNTPVTPTNTPEPTPTDTPTPAPPTNTPVTPTNTPDPPPTDTPAPPTNTPITPTNTPEPTPTDTPVPPPTAAPEPPTATPPPAQPVVAAAQDCQIRQGVQTRLQSVVDTITRDQDGHVEVSFRNPAVNDCAVDADLRVSVPTNIIVSSKDGGSGTAGTLNLVVADIRPGLERSISMDFKCLAVGDYTINFSGSYWPSGDKGRFQPITLQQGLTCEAVSVTPTPAPPVITPVQETPPPPPTPTPIVDPPISPINWLLIGGGLVFALIVIVAIVALGRKSN